VSARTVRLLSFGDLAREIARGRVDEPSIASFNSSGTLRALEHVHTFCSRRKSMSQKTFQRPVTTLSLLGVLGLVAACSSPSAATTPNAAAGAGGLTSAGGASATAGTGAEAGTPACPDFMGLPVVGPGPGGGCADGNCFSCVTPIEGMGFVTGMLSITDDSGVTTADLRAEPAGGVCMSGVNVGFAILSLTLGNFHVGLDALARHITEVEFTVGTPPSTGVVPQFTSHFIGFELMSDGQRESITSDAPQRVALSAFQSSGAVFDQSQVIAFGLTANPAEHYDFCVRDLKFFDADGVEVLPTP
jgi:hypothetical protein